MLLRGNMLKHSLLKRYACATTALLLLGLLRLVVQDHGGAHAVTRSRVQIT